jgi:dipeptidyl aminopeptidase/acylaminoacyl peptidase
MTFCRHALYGVATMLVAAPVYSSSPVTPRDCATVRYVLRDVPRHSIQLNPQGTYVAYLVKSPNLATNQNDIELFVHRLEAGHAIPSRELLSSPDTSSMQWEADGRHIAVLTKNANRHDVELIDVMTGRRSAIELPGRPDVAEYNITADGKSIVYATESASSLPTAIDLPRSADESAVGYRIPFSPPEKSIWPKRRIFLSRRTANGRWSKSRPIEITSPLTGAEMADIPYEAFLGLSISPDGRKLLFRYIDNSVRRPTGWDESPFVQQVLVENGFSGTPLLVMIDLDLHTTTVPMATPFPNGIAAWSADSTSFIINAQSPVGSAWEREDIRSKRLLASQGEHLFWVEVRTGTVQSVMKQNDETETLLSWNSEGDLLARTGPDRITKLRQSDGGWQAVSTIDLSPQKLSPYSDLAADDNTVVYDDQSVSIPPQLIVLHVGDRSTQVLQNLNPQFDSLTLASAKQVHWTLSDGYPLQGLLFEPPGYRPDRPYPLVISTIAYGGGFVCDSGDIHLPSFAPQPIANAGMLYLMRTYPPDWTLSGQREHYSKGYPGGVAEAAFQTEVWDSAVDKLAQDKIVDRERVGIIGFSRTGWYTEYALAHGRTPYRAATATDNVMYSLVDYWLPLAKASMQSADVIYGGPPYGTTLPSWEKYSISFNLDKIHTPLLMEEIGYGRQYDQTKIPPRGLIPYFEVFAGLSRLGTPVELYYYPNEDHQPEHPLARLASLQRNLAWYRFWLLGDPVGTTLPLPDLSVTVKARSH